MKGLHLARGLRAIAFGISVVVATSCTLLARDVEQCSSDGDCAGIQGRNRCIDNLCASSAIVPGDSGDGDTVAPGDAPGGPCRVSNDCANVDHICSREGECIPITEGPCAQRVPGQERPWRGEKPGPVVALYSVGSQGDSFEKRVVEAAIKQINPVIGTPMTVLLCSKGKKDAQGTARDVVTYLDRRGVPLVYGQFESVELAKLDTKGIAVWSTLGNASGSEASGTPPAANVTIRYLVDELRHLAPAYQPALDEAIKRVEKLSASTIDASNAKIFTVAGSSAESAPLENAILEAVTVKGAGGNPPETLKSLRASAPDRFKAYRPDAEFDVAVPAPLTDIITGIRALKPHVIIGIGGDEILGILDALEPPDPTARPIWLLSSRTKFNSEGIFQILNSTAQDLRHRLIGVDFPGNPAQVTFLDSIDGTSNTNALSYDHLFDATIAVALAYTRADAQRVAANVKTPLSGKELNDALSVLDPSDPDAVTMTGGASASIGATLPAIRSGKRVIYSGTTGQWKFFPTGSRDMTSFPLTYFCYPNEKTTTATNQLKLYQPVTELDGTVFSKCAAY